MRLAWLQELCSHTREEVEVEGVGGSKRGGGVMRLTSLGVGIKVSF